MHDPDEPANDNADRITEPMIRVMPRSAVDAVMQVDTDGDRSVD